MRDKAKIKTLAGVVAGLGKYYALFGLIAFLQEDVNDLFMGIWRRLERI